MSTESDIDAFATEGGESESDGDHLLDLLARPRSSSSAFRINFPSLLGEFRAIPTLRGIADSAVEAAPADD